MCEYGDQLYTCADIYDLRVIIWFLVAIEPEYILTNTWNNLWQTDEEEN
jgi:hypothetical protein